MATTRLAPELSIREYVASLDINASNVYYQTIRSNNVSTNGVQWSITSPNKRSVLLSHAVVQYQPTFTRIRDDGVNLQPWEGSSDQVSFKPVLPFTNAMTSQTISVNGNSLTLSQPRRFSELVSRMCVGQAESHACYESGWWDSQGGNAANNRQGHNFYAANIDEGLRQNEYSTKRKFLDSLAGNVALVTLDGVQGGALDYQEPLMVPPFNAYAKVQSGMPDYMPWKWQSSVIPNIDRLEIEIQFAGGDDTIAAACLNYRWAQNNANDSNRRFRMTALAANLLLAWYELPATTSIPRSVTLQTWNLREFQTNVGVVANSQPTLSIQTDLIQLRSVPSLILLHARRNQDQPDYLCQAMSADSDFFGNNPQGSFSNVDGTPAANANHSLDTFLEIISMNVLVGDRPNVISTTFTQRELYDLTLKNSKYLDFSLDFTTWKGPVTDEAKVADATPATAVVPTGISKIQRAKSFLAIQPKDVAEKISSGIFFPSSLQFEVNFRARDGAYGATGGDHTYTMYTHVITGKHWLTVEPDRALFEEQNVSLDAFARAARPSLVSDSPAPGAAALRGMADSAYQPKF